MARSSSANDNGPFVYKWRSGPNVFNSPDNYYILRLADIMLMYAEAMNEQSGPNQDALNRLNAVRTRAGLRALTLSDVATRQALRNEIDRQRRLELAFEGERWFDLLRYSRQATGSVLPIRLRRWILFSKCGVHEMLITCCFPFRKPRLITIPYCSKIRGINGTARRVGISECVGLRS